MLETTLPTIATSELWERVRPGGGPVLVDALPPMYREILALYHFEHLKYTEIATALDLPLGTVMNRIFRARQKLRALLEGDEAGA